MNNRSSGQRSNNKGFSLVEMIVYGAILVVFLGVLATTFSSILEVQLGSEATAAVAQDSRYLLSRFAYDIGRASAIVTPASLGEQSTSLSLTINGVAYTYAINNGNLELTNGSETNVLNSAGTVISGLSFRRYGNMGGKHSVRIAFTLTSTTVHVSGPEVRNFQTTIALR